VRTDAIRTPPVGRRPASPFVTAHRKVRRCSMRLVCYDFQGTGLLRRIRFGEKPRAARLLTGSGSFSAIRVASRQIFVLVASLVALYFGRVTVVSIHLAVLNGSWAASSTDRYGM
jgi:hypothetical protein